MTPMSPLYKALYFGGRNFTRRHPDFFVFAKVDPNRQQVELSVEYNGGFAVKKDPKTPEDAYMFAPMTSCKVSFDYIFEYRKHGAECVEILYDKLYTELMEQFDIIYVRKETK